MVDSFNRSNGSDKTAEPLEAEEVDDLAKLLDSVPLTMRMN